MEGEKEPGSRKLKREQRASKHCTPVIMDSVIVVANNTATKASPDLEEECRLFETDLIRIPLDVGRGQRPDRG